MANDLFISYSHIDNRPWGPGQRRWVSELHEHLKNRLEMLLGRDVSIWRDEKLGGADELNERIHLELTGSTLFLCVLSPRYLTSDWCRKEIDLFLAKMTPGPAGKRPLFKVIKTPSKRSDEPEAIRELLGYSFFREAQSEKIYELYPSRDENNIDSQQFWQKLDDIAQDIQAFLDATSTSTPAAGGNGHGLASQPGGAAMSEPAANVLVARNPSGPAKAVYLAESTVDINLDRDKIRRDLVRRGYRVFPERSLPSTTDQLLAMLEADLGQSCLTVHPVGARYGFIPEGDTRSIVELQIEAATAKNGHADHLIWISPEIGKPADNRLEKFLDRLRREYTEREGLELLDQKSIEDLKTRVVEKLEAPPPIAATGPRAQAAQRIYLIYETELPEVKSIREHLQSLGFSVDTPLSQGTEAETRQDHQDTLVICDAVLVYEASPRQAAWVRAKQRDVLKAPGWGRGAPMTAQAVFLSASATAETTGAVADGFLIIRGGETFSADALTPFLAQLRQAMGTVR